MANPAPLGPAPINPAPINPIEPTFDRSPAPFGAGLPDPIVCDAAPRDLRQRTVHFAAKRMTDMRYVSGLDRETAERHFRWRPAVAPGGLSARDAAQDPAFLGKLQSDGKITVAHDDADRRVTVTWTDTDFGDPVVGAAIARPGYGSIVLGTYKELGFDPTPVARRASRGGRGPMAMRSRRRGRRRPRSTRRSVGFLRVRQAPMAC